MSPDGRFRSEEMASKFGKNLRRYRHQAGLSQTALGERASMHRAGVQGLERGDRVARADTMMKLAAALEISPMDLLKGIKWVKTGDSEGEFVIDEPTLRPAKRQLSS